MTSPRAMRRSIPLAWPKVGRGHSSSGFRRGHIRAAPRPFVTSRHDQVPAERLPRSAAGRRLHSRNLVREPVGSQRYGTWLTL